MVKNNQNPPNKNDSELLKQLMDYLPDSIFFKDLKSRFIKINKRCAEKFGIENPDDAVGKTDFDFFDDEHAQDAYDDEQKIINTGEPIINKEEKEILPHKNDEKRWTLTSKLPLLDENGKIIGTFGITRDITERKRRESELQESINIIGDQNKRLINFAHIVTHNLRNHSSNFVMLLSLLDHLTDEEEREELIGYLKDASDRLAETIDDLNEIVDKHNKVDKTIKEIDFSDHFKKVKETLAVDIISSNATLNESFPKDLTVKYNSAYLESILLNLLSNAIKYRHPERDPVIEITVDDNDDSTVLIVSDNGLGIDLDKYEDQLFGMYETFHDHKNSKGIGLYITKNQVQSLGGIIEVESEVDEGSTFKVHLRTNHKAR